MVTPVTPLSQKPAYGQAMLFATMVTAVLLGFVEGPVAAVVAFFLSCAAVGGIAAAWASMIASTLHPRPGQRRIAAFRSAELDRWGREGLAVGSTIGLLLILLDLWLPA